MQVKIEISHHTLGDEWKNVKPLVFLVDEPKPEAVKKEKDKKSKKKKGPSMTAKNFGAHLQLNKVKEAQILSLAWRCRFLGRAHHHACKPIQPPTSV